MCKLLTHHLVLLYIRLEEEGANNQRLQHEKIAAEGKIKTLEEQLTVSEDSIIKVSSTPLNY